VFGIAKNAEIRTVRGDKLNVFRLNLDDMLGEARKTGKYTPESISINKDTEEDSGTTITLTNLTRKTDIDVRAVNRGIAKHFVVIGDGFLVRVNGEPILPADKFTDDSWEKKWDCIEEPVSKGNPEWVVSGWIGATKRPLAEEDRGIIVTARGKLIQSPTMFGMKSGSKFSYSYLAGEIRAEFCDGAMDSIATDRHSIMDTEQGIALRKWGAEKMGSISNELTEIRRAARERTVRNDADIRAWLDTLDGQQIKTANKIIKIVTSDEKLDDAKRRDLINYARASFEQRAFLDLVSTLDENPDPATLLDLFKEYNMVEARELERIVMSRLHTVDKLIKFMNNNTREVPELHKYFRDAPWMLDPTWTKWQDEVSFSRLLKQKYPDKDLDESDRRIDFMAIGVSDTVHVIELKRPKHRLKSEDFTQLANYVGFIKSRLGNDPKYGYRDVAGYLIVGAKDGNAGVWEMIRIAENARYYVRTYDDLVASAKQLHKHFDDKMKEFEKARSSAR